MFGKVQNVRKKSVEGEILFKLKLLEILAKSRICEKTLNSVRRKIFFKLKLLKILNLPNKSLSNEVRSKKGQLEMQLQKILKIFQCWNIIFMYRRDFRKAFSTTSGRKNGNHKWAEWNVAHEWFPLFLSRVGGKRFPNIPTMHKYYSYIRKVRKIDKFYLKLTEIDVQIIFDIR